jgi:DNA mismatch repair protein MutS
VEDELKTREEYLRLYKIHKAEYGEKMFLLYEVGSFYEVYAVKKENQYYETNIEDFSRICSLAISANTTMVRGVPYVMTGFNSYMIDKYVATILAASYTAVVYSQYDASPTATEEPTAKGKKKKEAPKKIRKLDAIYSPGTYVPYDVDQSHQMTNNVVVIWIDTIRPRKTTARDHVICGIASANIYTGQTNIFEYQTIYYPNPTTFDELERVLSVLNPSESVFITTLSKEEIENVIQYVHVKTNHIHILYDHSADDTPDKTVQNAKKQTYIKTILDATYNEEVYDTYKEFQEKTYATQAFVYLLHFMKERNPDLIKKIKLPLFVKTGSRVLLANYTLRQLNVIDDGEHKGQYSSLNSLLNKCASPMGRRKIYEQITAPTYDEEWLQREYHTIQDVLDINAENPRFISDLRRNIGQIKDIEKICRQIILKRIYPSAIYSLYKSVQRIRQINIGLFPYPNLLGYLSSIGQGKNVDEGSHIESLCLHVLGFLDKFFVVEKCKDVNSIAGFDHTMIQPGVNKTLDAYVKEYAENTHRFHTIHTFLNNMMRGSHDFAAENSHFVKIHETEKSGASLQITKTRSAKLKSIFASGPKVLQITKDYSIPVEDIKFVSPSKTIDEITSPQIVEILHKIAHLKVVIGKEVEVIFKSLLTNVESELYDKLENLVEYITYLDVLQNKAYIAREYNYCQPHISEQSDEGDPSFFDIRELRHPLIEHIQQNEIYVTNDLVLSHRVFPEDVPQTSHIETIPNEGINCTEGARGILIYGTNAVGKTSFIRAVGLAILMAQSGFYVPAATFHYRPYKSVFSRILGNDNLFKGLSTFAVEMSELRVILKYADQNSLILGDELCSGTEMESALSIFTTGLMNLYDKEATFLFATHFHEILEYDEIKEMQKGGHVGVKHMAVHYDREHDTLVYDRKLTDGPGNRLYGLEVCKSLYLEADFLEQAYKIRNKYHPDTRGTLAGQKAKYNARKIRGQCEMCRETMGEEIHHLSPQKDANKDGFIGHFHKNHPANLANICEKCHINIHRQEAALSPVSRKKTTGGYVLTL